MKKLFKAIIVLVILGGLGYYFRAPLSDIVASLQSRYLPCTAPITYDIGTFDKEFSISQADFLVAVAKAEAIWEKPIGKNLFEYKIGGYLKMNLIYDNRQAATQKLQKLGIVVGSNRAAYDNLKTKYETMYAQYAQDKESYEAKVAEVNGRGGAAKDEYQRLAAEQARLNTEVDALNAMAAELNELARTLNLNVETYNTIGSSNGEEFNEGLYVSEGTRVHIDIYQYENQTKLVRVLAHELGHALGLNHVEDPKAIMYRLNQATNEKLTADDLAALKMRCGVQ